MQPKRVALLAGWFAQYIVPLLFDNFKTIEWIENFEMDGDIKKISYKFNKRYKDDKKYKVFYKQGGINKPMIEVKNERV